MSEKKMYMCSECNRVYEYDIDAEKCHKRNTLPCTVNIPDRYTTITVMVEKEDTVFYYLNSYNNLREVPPRAKIFAEWEEPVFE